MLNGVNAIRNPPHLAYAHHATTLNLLRKHLTAPGARVGEPLLSALQGGSRSPADGGMS